MLGNFTYTNPTRLSFGEDALKGLEKELPNFGPHVMLVYEGGSIKKNEIYDQIIAVLHRFDKHIIEDAGVMPKWKLI